MAVKAGWVGSSAKAETGKAWMGDARVALRLPRAGWMSEMVGRSVEIRYVNSTNHTQANIHALMGSPTVPNIYIFENTATISAASRGGWALQTGTFPAGSTLRIINRGHIRGGGGNGGNVIGAGSAGGTALIINFPTTIDNTGGTIWGGGGGGGSAGGGALSPESGGGGGGGAGILAGLGGTGNHGGAAGTATAGGVGGGRGGRGGSPGTVGSNGSSRDSRAGGRGGYSVQRNNNAVTWAAVGDRRGSVV